MASLEQRVAALEKVVTHLMFGPSADGAKLWTEMVESMSTDEKVPPAPKGPGTAQPSAEPITTSVKSAPPVHPNRSKK